MILQRTTTILIIDDDIAVRGWIAEVLLEAGYAVRVASDGSAAGPELRATPIDVLITDIVMPGQEGIETIQSIRSEFPQVKIIAMSGANTTYLRLAALLGANATLAKPFSADQLLQTIRQLFG